MEKRIAVVVVGTGKIHDKSIKPGTTAGEVLASIPLDNRYWLAPNADSPFWGRDEVIYPQVQDGQKVLATPKVEVGR
jgi:hypothetical protein